MTLEGEAREGNRARVGGKTGKRRRLHLGKNAWSIEIKKWRVDPKPDCFLHQKREKDGSASIVRGGGGEEGLERRENDMKDRLGLMGAVEGGN